MNTLTYAGYVFEWKITNKCQFIELTYSNFLESQTIGTWLSSSKNIQTMLCYAQVQLHCSISA